MRINWCKIGLHKKPVKITSVMHIYYPDAFDDGMAEHFAGAICPKCKKVWLEKIYGSFSYYSYEKITHEKAMQLLNEAKHDYLKELVEEQQ